MYVYICPFLLEDVDVVNVHEITINSISTISTYISTLDCMFGTYFISTRLKYKT